MSLGNNAQVTLGGNRTLGIPTNIVPGQMGLINTYQDITGGRTLTYGLDSSQAYFPYQFQGGSTIILTAGKACFDQITYCVNSYSVGVVTITIADPGVITWTGHTLITGQRLILTTTGSLPTGLTANTTYWITKVDSNSIKLSASFVDMQDGIFITTSGSQSGTHTLQLHVLLL